MSQHKNLECEVFLTSRLSTREQLAESLGTLPGYSAAGFEVASSVLEIEVRNNPRLKGISSAELQRLRADTGVAFMYSDLVLEVCPASETVNEDEFVSEMKRMTACLIRSGFSVRVATDLDVDLVQARQ